MQHPATLLKRKTGDWWADERRNWCAYCGCGLSADTSGGARRTRDHVLPRVHKGRHITIPACAACNGRRGNLGLPEFLTSEYFAGVRSDRSPRAWRLRDLWLVVALAAVEQARSVERTESEVD